eukprot:6206270-Pleurochrysis_carterae.AAC.2
MSHVQNGDDARAGALAEIRPRDKHDVDEDAKQVELVVTPAQTRGFARNGARETKGRGREASLGSSMMKIGGARYKARRRNYWRRRVDTKQACGRLRRYFGEIFGNGAIQPERTPCCRVLRLRVEAAGRRGAGHAWVVGSLRVREGDSPGIRAARFRVRAKAGCKRGGIRSRGRGCACAPAVVEAVALDTAAHELGVVALRYGFGQ